MRNLKQRSRVVDGDRDAERLGLRLKLARLTTNLSLVEAARLLNLQPATLERYEWVPPILLQCDLAPFARLYQVRLDWLLTGQGSM